MLLDIFFIKFNSNVMNLNFKFELLSTGNSGGDQVAKIKRGLGTDLSMISSMVFVAQFSLSLFMGFIMKLTGTKTVVIYSASILASCAALSSSKLLYFD